MKVSPEAKIISCAEFLKHKTGRFTFLETCVPKAYRCLAKNSGFHRTVNKFQVKICHWRPFSRPPLNSKEIAAIQSKTPHTEFELGKPHFIGVSIFASLLLEVWYWSAIHSFKCQFHFIAPLSVEQ